MAMFTNVLLLTVLCIIVTSARKIPFTNSEQVSDYIYVNDHEHATAQENQHQGDIEASNLKTNEHDRHNETHRKSFRNIDTRAYDNLNVKKEDNNPNIPSDQYVRYNHNKNRHNWNKGGEETTERRNTQNKKQIKINTTEKIHNDNNKDKTTKDNEVTPRTDKKYKKPKDQNEERWIWPDEEVATTTLSSENVTLADRASFAGDHCPTGQVKFNNVCVDED